jgi:hypothetical protein
MMKRRDSRSAFFIPQTPISLPKKAMLTLHVGLDESDFSGRSVLSLSSDLVGRGGEREEGGDGGFHEHRERDLMRVCLYVLLLGIPG